MTGRWQVFHRPSNPVGASPSATVRLWLVYLWAGPTTTVGLLAAAAAVVSGGSCRLVDGVIEAEGGWLRWMLRHLTFLRGGASAMTLGHVVLARDAKLLEMTRAHERVHVRQYERWGPFFVPAYLLGSVYAVLRGGRAYMDNPFEREAYGQS